MREPFAGISVLLSFRLLDQGAKEKCFRRIWEEYYPRLMVFASGHRGFLETEDLVQEIMEKVFRGIETYDPAWKFTTWVYAIARNHCLDRARRSRNLPWIQSLSDMPESGQPAYCETPEQEFLRREADCSVEAFLESADLDTRQLAFLRFHQGLGYRDISRIMGIPVGTVKFRMHVLREKLRDCIEER